MNKSCRETTVRTIAREEIVAIPLAHLHHHHCKARFLYHWNRNITMVVVVQRIGILTRAMMRKKDEEEEKSKSWSIYRVEINP